MVKEETVKDGEKELKEEGKEENKRGNRIRVIKPYTTEDMTEKERRWREKSEGKQERRGRKRGDKLNHRRQTENMAEIEKKKEGA